MIDWLHHSHADYVVAAYGLAAVFLVGFALLSWLWGREQNKKWRQLQQKQNELLS